MADNLPKVFTEKDELLAREGYKLKPREKTFLHHYLKTGRIIESIIKAGYRGSPSRLYRVGRRILDSPAGQLYYDELEKRERREREVTKDYLVMKLKEIIETSSTKIPDKINALQTLAKVTNNLNEGVGGSNKVVVLQTIGLEDREQLNVDSLQDV